MLTWLRKLLTPQPEDYRIETDAMVLTFNHPTKTAVLMCFDPDTKDETYLALDAHLAKRGYFLQVIIPSVILPHASGPQDNTQDKE